MKLKKLLADLARVVAEEADRNPSFRKSLLTALGQKQDSPAAHLDDRFIGTRPKNRRAAAVFDPIEIAVLGEEALKSELSALNVEQLLDIVSDYGMDPGRIVVKWKSPERIIDRIIEIAVMRARKGNAFRPDQT